MQKDFSYPLAIDDLSAAESNYVIRANEGELECLKELLKVQAVRGFKAFLKVKLDRKRHLLKVKGDVKSLIELQSVVSLDRFTKEYSGKFELVFDTNPSFDAKEEEELDFDDEIIDSIVDGKVDLWQLAIEQLALLIDDYPRKDGENFSFATEFSEQDKKNPFDVLVKLKK